MAPERTKVEAGESANSDQPPSDEDAPAAVLPIDAPPIDAPPIDAPPIDELLDRRLPDRLTRTNLSNLRFVEDYVLEAERLVRELKAAVVAMQECGFRGTSTGELRDAFEAAWESELSVDERAADRAFFDELTADEPSRSWILADT